MLAPAIFTSIPADLLVVLVIVLLFFGPKRLPGLGRSLGSGIREFKDGISDSGTSAVKEFKDGMSGSDDASDQDKSELQQRSGSGDPGSAG